MAYKPAKKMNIKNCKGQLPDGKIIKASSISSACQDIGLADILIWQSVNLNTAL